MLYVHVPFCRAKCAYCDFYSSPRSEWMEGYVDAVAAEAARRIPRGWRAPTLYLGGGTPSSLPLSLLERLIGSLPLADTLEEATIETNPEDVTPAWVEGILGHTPLRRVSMGIQSLDDDELQAIGRRHTAAKALEAYTTLREGGVGNIALDLIYGLPGQSVDSWKRSLEGVLALRPDHLSAYLLSYEPRTRLGVMLSRGKVREADEETVSEMYEILCRLTREAGYEHYEISNFALPGRRAVHNSGYWSGRPYIGLGPGAHSWWQGQRGENPARLAEYIRRAGEGYAVEDEDEMNRYNDLIITRLRTAEGLRPDEVRSNFTPEIADEFERTLLTLPPEMLRPDGSIAIPERLWLESNQLMLKLIIV